MPQHGVSETPPAFPTAAPGSGHGAYGQARGARGPLAWCQAAQTKLSTRVKFPQISFAVRMCIVQYWCVVNTDQNRTCLLNRTGSLRPAHLPLASSPPMLHLAPLLPSSFSAVPQLPPSAPCKAHARGALVLGTWAWCQAATAK